jgi:hypothetical protein
MRKGNDGGLFGPAENKEEIQLHIAPTNALGISLGVDFCAEHEWGIAGLSRRLGLKDQDVKRDILGLDSRTVDAKKWQEQVQLIEVEDMAMLVLDPHLDSSKLKTVKDLSDRYCELYLRDKNAKSFAERRREVQLEKASTDEERVSIEERYQEALTKEQYCAAWATAWSDRDFGVLTRGEENVEFLRRLYTQGCKGEIALVFMNPHKHNPFSSSTLCIIDKEFTPAATAQIHATLREAELSADRLDRAVDATGIRDRLEKAGLRYYALSPRWVNSNDETTLAEGSQYPFQFWLNPQEQRDNNSCWCTVEDLDRWIAGEGKIPKQAEPAEEADPKVLNS